MKVLITGRLGFVGGYLDKLLTDAGLDVYGYDLRNGEDLRNYEQLRNTLDKIRPDYIYHLAAQAFVAESFSNPARAIEINTVGSLNLLEAVRHLGLKPKILLAGTSEEYGNGEVEETSVLMPASPYAVGKAAMDQLGQLYSRAYGMNIVITRAFNHTGPGRGEMYAESAFAKQIVEIERGQRQVLEHGNLEPMRNYTDVRDVVRAYQMAIDLPSDVYNICSDQNINIKGILNTLITYSKVKIQTRPNPELYRPYDFSFQKPNCSKFIDQTGWKPTIVLKYTLAEIMNYWRDQA